MPQSSGNFDVLLVLLKEQISRSDAQSERICDEIKSLRDAMATKDDIDEVNEKISKVEIKVDNHGESISKHNHYFNTMVWLVTSGITGVIAFCTWISGTFKGMFPH